MLQDIGIITRENKDFVIDKDKIKRQEKKLGKKI